MGLHEYLRRLPIDVEYNSETVVDDRLFVATDGSAKDGRWGGGAVLRDSNGIFFTRWNICKQ